MRCPTCDDVTLVISSREGIEIDHCPECRGVWLDRGELDKIIERAAPSVVGGGRAPAPPPAPSYREEPRREEPRRDEPRRDDRYREDDRDRYRSDDRDRDRYRSDDRYKYDKKRKKRSFLEDIFDFD